MKKIVCLFITTILVLLGFVFTAQATDDINTENLSDEIRQELSEIIDSDVRDALEDIGISDFDFSQLYNISFSKISDYFAETLKDKISGFAEEISQLFCVIFICSIVASVFDVGNNSMFNTICTIVIILLSVGVASESLSATISVLKTSGKFVVGFAPIYTMLISFAGNTALALTYNTFVMFLGELISYVITFGVKDFIGIYFCLGISFSINEGINLNRFVSVVNKITYTVLGFTASVFSGFLSLKSILSISLDKVSVKSIRFLISSMIPVVGSSISDAYSSLLGSINLIKGSVAFIGIIVIVIINLPIIVENLICYISFTILSYVADSFLSVRTAEVLRFIASGVRFLLLLSVFEMFIIIITVGITLSARGGA